MKKIHFILLSLVLFVSLFTYICVENVHAQQNNSGYIRVETGETHVVALKDDGTVWAWGQLL